MELVLYLLGAVFVIMVSVKMEPKAELHLHILSGVFWPFLVVLVIVLRIVGYERI